MANEARQANDFVRYKIRQWTESKNDSTVKATLAKLRRGIGKTPGSVPELWDATLNGLSEDLISKDGNPTRGEWAVHVALTLFALHQQGKDLKKQCMSRDGAYLGIAVRHLVQSEEAQNRIKRRFDSAVTSDSMEEFSHHLRGLIQLLKAGDIPLDYPALAEDLYRYQFPDQRDFVRLRWGQDFYRIPGNEENNNDKE